MISVLRLYIVRVIYCDHLHTSRHDRWPLPTTRALDFIEYFTFVSTILERQEVPNVRNEWHQVLNQESNTIPQRYQPRKKKWLDNTQFRCKDPITFTPLLRNKMNWSLKNAITNATSV